MKFGFIAKHRGIWPVTWLRSAGCVSFRLPCLARASAELARRVRRDVPAEGISSGLHRVELLLRAAGPASPPTNVLDRTLAV